MPRRGSGGGGCGCLLLVLFGLPFAAWVVAAACLSLAAPAVVGYLLLDEPAEFAKSRTEWLVALAMAPIVAFVLSTWAGTPLTRRGRRGRRGRRRRLSKNMRKAMVRRGLLRSVLLLLVTNVTAAALLLAGNTAHGPHAAEQTFIVVGGTGAAAVIVVLLYRLWDRWFPPGVRPRAVSVESVRAATVRADETVQQVRAQNQQVRRLAEEVDSRLRRAQSEVDFVTLRDLHFASFGCADGAYKHYRSAGDSLRAMSRMLADVRLTVKLRLRAKDAGGRRRRPDRQALDAAAGNLTRSRSLLSVEVERGRAMVRDLNANTARLKHLIRDNCGERGRQWYDSLQERVRAHRLEESGATG
ncbi:hypothetical protein [Amycolatopsis sp. NPDC021455]|uniref:hypothetical protein n=1 Tax=Amycolatopsis sp. NPDC021455 TaxID=3154901 RepID=UPI0033E92066